MSGFPHAQIQVCSPGSRVVLYTLDATGLGGSVYRFHPGLNEKAESVTWQGHVYEPMPIDASGFEESVNGGLPRPKLVVSNLDGVVAGFLRDLDDLINAKVTRQEVLVQFLDAVNFVDGNLYADPTAGFPEEVWVINQRTAETPKTLEFELAAISDAQGLKIPSRMIVTDVCGWTQTADCPYVGTCGKLLTDCKSFYGSHALLPFGAFPGAKRAS